MLDKFNTKDVTVKGDYVEQKGSVENDPEYYAEPKK